MDFIDGNDDSVDGGVDSDDSDDSEDSEDSESDKYVIPEEPEENISDSPSIKSGLSDFVHGEFDRSSETHNINAVRSPIQYENSNQSALTDFEDIIKGKSTLMDF